MLKGLVNISYRSSNRLLSGKDYWYSLYKTHLIFDFSRPDPSQVQASRPIIDSKQVRRKKPKKPFKIIFIHFYIFIHIFIYQVNALIWTIKIQGNSLWEFGRCPLSCWCSDGKIDSVFSVTNSWHDISRTLSVNSPV